MTNATREALRDMLQVRLQARLDEFLGLDNTPELQCLIVEACAFVCADMQMRSIEEGEA